MTLLFLVNFGNMSSKFFTYFFSFTFLFVSNIFSQIENVKTGLRDPTQEQLETYIVDDILGSSQQNNIGFPNKVNLSKFLPGPLDQGAQESCTAFSVSYCKTIIDNIRNNIITFPSNQINDLTYSPSFLFNLVKQNFYNDGCNSGISFIDALLTLRDSGSIKLSRFGYNPTSINACLQDIPSGSDLQAAKDNRIFTFKRPDLELTQFKKILTQGIPICISTRIQKDNLSMLGDNKLKKWSTTKPFIWRSYNGSNIDPKFLDKHAMLVVGYDDTLQSFIILNSWGSSFGVNGLFYIPYDFAFSNTWGPIYDAYIIIDKKKSYSYNENFKLGSSNKEKDYSSTQIRNIDENEPFEDSSKWFKAGYYQNFLSFKVGCFDIDPVNQIVLVRFTDMDKIINQFELKVGEEIKFSYKFNSFRVSDVTFKITKIGHAGSIFNYFHKAAFIYIKISDFRVDDEGKRVNNN